MARMLTPVMGPKQDCPPYSPVWGGGGWDTSTMLPWEAAPFSPLLTRIPAPRELSSACSGDCLAQGHTLLLQHWDHTWVRWFAGGSITIRIPQPGQAEAGDRVQSPETSWNLKAPCA